MRPLWLLATAAPLLYCMARLPILLLLTAEKFQFRADESP